MQIINANNSKENNDPLNLLNEYIATKGKNKIQKECMVESPNSKNSKHSEPSITIVVQHPIRLMFFENRRNIYIITINVSILKTLDLYSRMEKLFPDFIEKERMKQLTMTTVLFKAIYLIKF